MVASECAQARRYSPVMNSRDSSGEANMSDIGSDSSQASGSAHGRPKVSPKYPISTPAMVLDQAEQVGAGRHQRTADVVLG